MIRKPYPNDNDMFRASAILLREVRDAATWISMMQAVETLGSVRRRHEEMKAEYEMLTRPELGPNSAVKASDTPTGRTP